LRSVTQATDSTVSGWTASTAAAKALRYRAPVSPSSMKKTRSTFAAWNSTFTTWWPAGFSPKSCTSSIRVTMVTGIQ
jgi:hypothetical protein